MKKIAMEFDMERIGRQLSVFLSWGVLLLAMAASAQSSLVSGQAAAEGSMATVTEATAHDVVQLIQDRLLMTIEDNRDQIDSAPEQYYDAVGVVLEPVVDFSYIARIVMGGFVKQATPEQQALFVVSFKRGLVATYAKGMASFADQEIVVLPPKGDISGQRKVSVAQEVRGGDSVNRVSYTMARNRAGEWKLINVVLNGINLGKTFRSQFSQAMKKSNGDMDKVISDWFAEG